MKKEIEYLKNSFKISFKLYIYQKHVNYKMEILHFQMKVHIVNHLKIKLSFRIRNESRWFSSKSWFFIPGKNSSSTMSRSWNALLLLILESVVSLGFLTSTLRQFSYLLTSEQILFSVSAQINPEKLLPLNRLI